MAGEVFAISDCLVSFHFNLWAKIENETTIVSYDSRQRAMSYDGHPTSHDGRALSYDYNGNTTCIMHSVVHRGPT